MPTYHLTIFPLVAWAKKKIDKIRRSFLWKGDENANANGGHCLVNWPTVTRPKDLGGLGVPDLERFGHALRLRWLWQDWTEDSKPWAGIDLPCNDIDRLLFNSSTTVSLGDGAKARFWHNNWLDGEAPRYLAPNLFPTGFQEKQNDATLASQQQLDTLPERTHYDCNPRRGVHLSLDQDPRRAPGPRRQGFHHLEMDSRW
jgi:hypothetical protein